MSLLPPCAPRDTLPPSSRFFFFFNDTATTEIYTLSLHDALPISSMRCNNPRRTAWRARAIPPASASWPTSSRARRELRSEEHTSELQSRLHLVCRLLLEKKKKEDKQQDQPPMSAPHCDLLRFTRT